MLESIVNIDDVRHALGSWLLAQESLTPSEVKKHVHAARELAALVELNLRLKDVTDAGFKTNYFSPDARKDIRGILDEMDAVSAGTHTLMRRRNETLSKGAKDGQ